MANIPITNMLLIYYLFALSFQMLSGFALCIWHLSLLAFKIPTSVFSCSCVCILNQKVYRTLLLEKFHRQNFNESYNVSSNYLSLQGRNVFLAAVLFASFAFSCSWCRRNLIYNFYFIRIMVFKCAFMCFPVFSQTNFSSQQSETKNLDKQLLEHKTSKAFVTAARVRRF